MDQLLGEILDGLPTRPGDVRRDDQVVEPKLEQRIVRRWRLALENVDASPADAPAGQRVREVGFDDDSAAGAIDQQLNDDGSARMDFDLPDADIDRLRALEAAMNDVIAQDLPLRTSYVPLSQAAVEHGLIRSRSVAPPPGPDGTIRVVEIVGLDRQACGGTHLRSTGQSRRLRILKVDNKGRHNRRIRIGLADP